MATQRFETAPRKVLLVEADEVAARVSTFWLERAGFRVRLVDSGEAALAAVAETSPQVVVAAVLLPDMDGWTLLQRLRDTTGGTLPAVVVSVLERHVLAEHAGEAEYLNKPFAGHDLVRAVRRALRRASCGRLPRLLVVHEQESELRHISQLLDDAGFDVIEALGSEEACVLALAGAAPIQAVVVALADPERFIDCLQPHVDGDGLWLRLGTRPQRGAWRAVVDSPTGLAMAVEDLFGGQCKG